MRSKVLVVSHGYEREVFRWLGLEQRERQLYYHLHRLRWLIALCHESRILSWVNGILGLRLRIYLTLYGRSLSHSFSSLLIAFSDLIPSTMWPERGEQDSFSKPRNIFFLIIDLLASGKQRVGRLIKERCPDGVREAHTCSLYRRAKGNRKSSLISHVQYKADC